MVMKTNLDTMFMTDREAEEDGIWVDLDAHGKKIKIRAFGAKKVTDLREKLMRPFQMLQRTGGKLDDDVSEDIGLKVLAGGVIADWAGIMGTEGEGDAAKEVAIPYNADNAYDILKAMPKFATFVINIATDTQIYKDGLREEGAKN